MIDTLPPFSLAVSMHRVRSSQPRRRANVKIVLYNLIQSVSYHLSYTERSFIALAEGRSGDYWRVHLAAFVRVTEPSGTRHESAIKPQEK